MTLVEAIKRSSVKHSITNSLKKAKENVSHRVLKKKNANAWYFIFEDDSDDSLIEELTNKCDEISSNSIRLTAGAIIQNNTFQTGMVVIIILNSFVMGIATLDFIETDPRWIKIVDNAFLSCFTIEVFLKVTFLQRKFFTNPEYMLDLLVVILSWAYTTIRIFRTLLLLDRVRAFKFIVKAVASIYSGMLSILMLLVILIYIFAVVVTTLYSDAFDQGITSENLFGRLDLSFFTLFQILSFNNWMPITRELMVEFNSARLVIISYAILSGVVFLNLFLALFNGALVELKKSQVSIQISQESFRDLDHFSTYGSDIYVSRKIASLEEQIIDLLKLHRRTQEALDTLTNQLTDFVNLP